MRPTISFAVAFTLFRLVAAHPGEIHQRMSESELSTRQIAANKRHGEIRSCASKVAQYQQHRKTRRNVLRKRDTAVTENFEVVLGLENAPHTTEISESTCVTAPEVTEGPFYINNEMVRQDLSEDESGVKLILDIGVIDTATCEPLENVFVELWSANATGIYSSYDNLGGPQGPPSNWQDGSPRKGGPPHRPPHGPPGRGPHRSEPLVRNETFLRGGSHTNKNGMVELTTIFPGFYGNRAPHIHIMVHKDWQKADNGTLISHAGTVVHTGQIFFHEAWNDKVFSISPYTSNTNHRTLNKDDWILKEQNADGNNAYLDLELIGQSFEDGILGYITMGVNSSASYDIHNTNYLGTPLSKFEHRFHANDIIRFVMRGWMGAWTWLCSLPHVVKTLVRGT